MSQRERGGEGSGRRLKTSSRVCRRSLQSAVSRISAGAADDDVDIWAAASSAAPTASALSVAYEIFTVCLPASAMRYATIFYAVSATRCCKLKMQQQWEAK